MSLPTFPVENEKAPATYCFGQVGGPAVRALMTVRNFGGAASLVGAVGADAKGEMAQAELRQWGVATQWVSVHPDAPTRAAQVWLAQDTGSRTVVYAPEGPEVASFDPASLDGAAAVLLDTRHPEAAGQLVSQARAQGICVALGIGGFRDYLPDLVRQADVVIGPARTWLALAEAFQLADPWQVMGSLPEATCVLTDGARQVVAMRGAQRVEHLPLRVKVADSNGAGDVFFGAFMWAHTNTYDLSSAVRFASAAAALKCTRVGNQGLPGLEEVVALQGSAR